MLGFGLMLATSSSGAGTIEVAVSLNPVGSFVAKSSSLTLKGPVKVSGSSFALRNAILPVKTLKSGIDLRDTHMHEKYLENAKFPNAVLTKASGKGGVLSGELKVHGQAIRIKGTYELSKQKLVANFKCKLSDFKIAEAQYRGVGVEDEVDVKASLTLPKTTPRTVSGK